MEGHAHETHSTPLSMLFSAKALYAVALFVVTDFVSGPMDGYCFFLVVIVCANLIFVAVNSSARHTWLFRGIFAGSIALADAIILAISSVHDDDHREDGGRRNLRWFASLSALGALGYFVFSTFRECDAAREDGALEAERRSSRVLEICERYFLSRRQVESVLRYRDGRFPKRYFERLLGHAEKADGFEQLSPLDQENALAKAAAAGVTDIEKGMLLA